LGDILINVPVCGVVWVLPIKPAADPDVRIIGTIGRPAAGVQKLVVIVIAIHAPGERELFVVGHALQSLGLEFAFIQRGQKECGQNGDDSNDNEKFDQSETV